MASKHFQSLPIASAAVAQVFDHYPPDIRRSLMQLRGLILETAANTEDVGELEETLKWGQPSYLTAVTKSGTTIRIDQIKSSPGEYAMYFHCQTNLVETFRTLYPNDFRFDGNRALVFNVQQAPPTDSLRYCIAAALTYHARRGKPR